MIRNRAFLEQAISKLGLHFEERKSEIIVGGIVFTKRGPYYVARFQEDQDLSSNRIIDQIEKQYEKIYQEYLEDLRRKKEAIEREERFLKEVEKAKLEEEKRLVEKELRKLEQIKQMEQKRQMQKINETVEKITERAEREGFRIQIIQQENKRVIKLVRG